MYQFTFVEGDAKSFQNSVAAEMEKPIKHFEKELAALRTGRASIALLEHIKVDIYGSQMSLKELATLGAPEGRLLTVQPWDKSVIPDIEKAILNSDLGAAPINDGTLIRIQLPQMSASRRDELVKLLGKKTEECKVAVRNVRKEYHNLVREAEKKHTISEDFAAKLSDVLQKVTDQFVAKTDEMAHKKENEVRTI